MVLPLNGIKIIDLTQNLPGPYCTMLLSDLGAKVIKVERPDTGDFGRAWPMLFSSVNRNKQSITINLKSCEGVKIIKQLAAESDVLVEGFRPGVVEQLGIGYRDVSDVNPGIVYCSISGFGQDGPLSNAPGHDVNYGALSGLLSMTGIKGDLPIVPGIPTADLNSSMFAIMGILTALLARKDSGKGQYVDVSMLDSMISWMSFISGHYFESGDSPIRGEVMLTSGVIPSYGVYETKDRKYITLGILEDKFWRDFCRAAGCGDLADSQFATGRRGKSVIAKVKEIIRSRTRDEWDELLGVEGINIPYAPVLSVGEALNHPQVVHRRMVDTVNDHKGNVIKQVSMPIKFSEAHGEMRSGPPELGEHTEDILKELGYSKDEITKLRDNGAV